MSLAMKKIIIKNPSFFGFNFIKICPKNEKFFGFNPRFISNQVCFNINDIFNKYDN
jgi:hypothetical protein